MLTYFCILLCSPGLIIKNWKEKDGARCRNKQFNSLFGEFNLQAF